MAKISKRVRALREQLEAGKIYTIDEALSTLKDVAAVKFSESVEIAINLGIDARKSDQVVRGATTLPNGTGKTVRVAVFTQGANEQKAKDAGADLVGMEDLAEEIKKGNIDFDVVIASPDAMPTVGKLGQILGPRGLMPNPKTGTVTPDVATAVKNAKAGQVRFRNDKGGIVSAAVGTRDFEVAALKENIVALLADLQKLKPASAKGHYVKKITVSTTMGPGLQVDVASLVA